MLGKTGRSRIEHVGTVIEPPSAEWTAPAERRADETNSILSVGIDIGTSTTKMIVSRLWLRRASGALSLPRFEIAERELLYASPIYTTPLISRDEVDAEKVWRLLQAEYAQAGIQPSEIKSGAVIITGDTANTRNAQSIVHKLAERSGDFVVATAGADLEGLLAGLGAGADLHSRHTRGAIANIDIGGGTANAALFYRGKPVGTVTFHVGGRLIQVDARGVIKAVSPSLQPWLQAAGYRLLPGQTVRLELLKEICDRMCRSMLSRIAQYGSGEADRPASFYTEDVKADELLLFRDGAASRDPADKAENKEAMPALEAWMISGGVGALLQAPAPLTEEESWLQIAVHQDMGPLLAESLRRCLRENPVRLLTADQTSRATVIGAGMQSTMLSGATVYMDAGVLPVRNVPVVKLRLSRQWSEKPEQVKERLSALLQRSARLYSTAPSGGAPPLALAVTGLQHWGYHSLQLLSGAVAESYIAGFPDAKVLVVACDHDTAKALGQALAIRCGARLRIICIDQISVEHGDYIDLGEPIAGMMLPVVVKTLAFQPREEGEA